MNLKKLPIFIFRSLSRIYFSVFLLASTATLVAIGTFIESKTQSHLLAENWIYEHWIFKSLLWGFFINIAFSALSRWPFKRRHTGFLLTHLGLLMVLAGQLSKAYLGVQGNVLVVEGAQSDEVFLKDLYSLNLYPTHSSKDHTLKIPLKNKKQKLTLESNRFEIDGGQLSISLEDFMPHAHEKIEVWNQDLSLIKQKLVNLPLPSSRKPYPIKLLSKQAPLNESFRDEWTKNALSKVVNPKTGASKTFPFKELENGVDWEGGLLKAQFKLKNCIHFQFLSDKNYEWTLNLQSLNFSPISHPHHMALPIEITIETSPSILIGEEGNKEHLFITFPNGQIHLSSRSKTAEGLMVEDRGKEGYWTSQTFKSSGIEKDPQFIREKWLWLEGIRWKRYSLPQEVMSWIGEDQLLLWMQFLDDWSRESSYYLSTKGNYHFNEKILSNEWINSLNISEELISALDSESRSIEEIKNYLTKHKWPLLKRFEGRESGNLEALVTDYYEQLHMQIRLVAPFLNSQTPTTKLPLTGRTFSQWLSFHGLHPKKRQLQLNQEEDSDEKFFNSLILSDSLGKILSPQNPRPILASDPLLEDIKKLKPNDSLFLELSQAFKKAYPDLSLTLTPLSLKEALTTSLPILKSYYNATELLDKGHPKHTRELLIEAPVQRSYQRLPLPSNPEQRSSNVLCKISFEKEGKKEEESLRIPIDAMGQGLPWPLKKIPYQIQIKPTTLRLPFKIQLHQARQLDYPGSQQAYSYESDLFIHYPDTEKQPHFETISMNEVYESKEGYRLYMANLFPKQPIQSKHALITINKAPLKYLLTYLGGIFVAIGILILLVGLSRNAKKIT